MDAVIDSPPLSQDMLAGDPGQRGSAARAPGRYLTFHLGGETYCLDILHVQEIRGYAAPTRIASAPPAVKGVVNLRGTIVPVVDLRQVFGIAQARYDDVTATIVIAVGPRRAGVIVDAVEDVIELQPDQIAAPPLARGTGAREFITGLATLASGEASGMHIVLDIATLLASPGVGLA